MKIVRYGLENIQSIKLAEIPLNGITIVTGKNGAGKSTMLKGMDWIFHPPGGKHGNIVRHGAANGRAWQETEGGYIFERVFNADGSTKAFTCRSKDPLKPVSGTAAQMVKALFESNGMPWYNPSFFSDLTPVERRQHLFEVVGVDPEPYDAKIKATRDAAKAFDADLAAIQNRFAGAQEYKDVPDSPVSVLEISARLEAAQAHNAAIERGNDITEGHKRERTQLLTKIRELEERLAALKENLKVCDAEIEAREKKAAEIQTIDLAPIRAEIEAAEETNEKVRRNQAIRAARAEWQSKEPERARLEAEAKAAEDEKRKALMDAKFPAPEIGFDEFDVTWNGVPWDQASESERDRGSYAMWKHGRGKVETIAMEIDSLDAERRESLFQSLAAEGLDGVVALDIERAAGETGCVIEIVDGEVAA